MRTVAVGLVGLLVLFSQGAAAQEERAEFRFETPGKLQLVLLQTQENDRANNTRRQIDQSGNGDGVVTTAEVEAAEQTFLNFTRQFGNSSGTAGDFTIDGKNQSRIAFDSIEIRNAEGPVENPTPLDIEVRASLEFNVTAGAEHTLRIRHNQSANDNLGSAVIYAPDGYRVKSAAGLPPGAAIAADKRSVVFDGPAQPESGELSIVFARTGGSLAGSTVVWLLVLLFLVIGAVGVAIVMRARRHP